MCSHVYTYMNDIVAVTTYMLVKNIHSKTTKAFIENDGYLRKPPIDGALRVGLSFLFAVVRPSVVCIAYYSRKNH